MSAATVRAEWSGPAGVETAAEREKAYSQPRAERLGAWNAESYAREQIRALARQVFLSNATPLVRQIVIGVAEPETDARSIALRVGVALAIERVGDIAVVGTYPESFQLEQLEGEPVGLTGRQNSLRGLGTRLRSNLWLVPAMRNRHSASAAALHSYLGEVRQEFECSILVGPRTRDIHELATIAQFTDGIILVLSARHSRRISAKHIKEKLEAANARIIGTVLSDRSFPIPEAIYRRL